MLSLRPLLIALLAGWAVPLRAIGRHQNAHMLFVDGVCIDRSDGSPRFRRVKAPTSAELTELAHTLARRVGRNLERGGLIARDAENS